MSVASLSALGDRTFGSLRRHRNYRLYFAGSFVSFIGTWMQQIAAYWLVLQLTHSAVAVGALGFVQGIAIALDAPARHTLVFQIVGREDLTNAVALSAGLGTSARIIGPAVGGFVVAAAGPGVAFALNA